MSSRIIRGGSRLEKPKITVQTGSGFAEMTQNHIMDVEKQAFEQGYAEGERIGKQMGEAMVESVCRRYEMSLTDLAVSHKAMKLGMEEQTVRFALEIARKIIQRELTMDADLVTALTHVALKRLSGHQSITLRLSRHDFQRVRTAIEDANPAVTVKEDPALERGDYTIETGQTHMDGRVASQIDAIGRALFDE
jgi:flagellar assembly protein FliH